MPLILGANSVSGYTIKNSLRFNSGSSDYLNRTMGSGDRQKYTYSFWIKKSLIATTQRLISVSGSGGSEGSFFFDTSDRLGADDYATATGYGFQLRTNRVFRDVSAWYHIVIAFDTTQSTSTNRIKLYINGEQYTWDNQTTQSSQNYNTQTNISGNTLAFGRDNVTSTNYYNGYMSEINFIDGQQLTPSSFGETDTLTGIWIPKAYTGTYGTNGFYLKFANSASLGTDSSGNGNNFTVNNLTSVDQTTDTPTNNFCTLNPLITPLSGSAGGLSDGNLTHTASYQNCGTFFIDKDSTGKWYWECKVISGANSSLDIAFGFSSDRNIRNDGSSTWAATNTLWFYSTNGSKYTGSWTSSAGATFTNGDIIGMALDLNGDTITFYKNGVSQFTISSLTIDGTVITPWIQNTVAGCIVSANFGNPSYSSNGYTDGAGYGNFSYSVPSGYYSLCTKNLATYG